MTPNPLFRYTDEQLEDMTLRKLGIDNAAQLLHEWLNRLQAQGDAADPQELADYEQAFKAYVQNMDELALHLGLEPDPAMSKPVGQGTNFIVSEAAYDNFTAVMDGLEEALDGNRRQSEILRKGGLSKL